MSDEIVSRTVRLVGAVAGAFFGVQLAVLGVFVELLAVTAVAGAFVGAGTALLVPALVYATHTGGFPPTTDESVLGTGLNPGALGMALDVAGLTVVFAGFVFESPPVPVAVGLGVLVACYALLDWGLPQSSGRVATDGSGIDPAETGKTASDGGETTDEDDPSTVASALGVVAGILLYTGVTAWSRSPTAAYALVGVAVVLVGVGARMEGYL